AKAIKGHPVLRAAAEDAARKWVFRPTLLDGKPVKQPGVLTFVFTPPRCDSLISWPPDQNARTEGGIGNRQLGHDNYFPLPIPHSLVVFFGFIAPALALVSAATARRRGSRNVNAGADAVDLLIVGGAVVTMNSDRRVFENGYVAIRAERVFDVGDAADLK